MAWGQRFSFGTYDLNGNPWYGLIFFQGYVGSITTLKGGSSPISFELLNSSDDVFDPIRPNQIKISIIVSDYNFTLGRIIYSAGVAGCYVELYQGYENSSEGTPYWVGFVDPKSYKEPYDVLPYEIELTCIDGLTVLEGMLYKRTVILPDDTYYTGRKLESQILLDIFAKINVDSFREYINIYEVDMNSDTDDSPMDQLSIDVTVFKDKKCSEVIEEILKKYNACIRLRDGIFNIFRPYETIKSVVYGRYFTGPTTKTAISYAPEKYIKRPSYSSELVQVPGGEVMIINPYKKITLKHNYGFRESWLDNYKFAFDSFKYAVPNFESWNSVNCGGLRVEFAGEEGDGVIIDTHNTSPNYDHYLYQTFGYLAKTTNDDFILEFDWLLYNASTAETGVHFYIQVYMAGHYLYILNDREYGWSHTTTYIDLSADAPMGSTGWMHFSRKITELPADGPITIKIYGVWSTIPNVYPGIKEILFTNISEYYLSKKYFEKITFPVGQKVFNAGILETILPNLFIPKFEKKVIVERTYEKTNAINGDNFDNTYLLGDVTDASITNVLEQNMGALSRVVRTTNYRVDTITLIGSSGHAAITCNGITSDALATYVTSPTQTATNWVAAASGDFPGITVTSSGPDIIFTHNTIGQDFTGDTICLNVDGNLRGTTTLTTPAISETYTPTLAWSRRNESQNLPLLDIIASEIAFQYSRDKQLAQIKMQEVNQVISTLNTIGCFRDSYNVDEQSAIRKFVINRGNFDIRNRSWNLDMMEVLDPDAVNLFTYVKPVFILNSERNNLNPSPNTRWHISSINTTNKSIVVDMDLPIELEEVGTDVNHRWFMTGTPGIWVDIISTNFTERKIYYGQMHGTFNVGDHASWNCPFRSFTLDPTNVVKGTETWSSTFVMPGPIWKHSDGTYRMVVNGYNGSYNTMTLYTSPDLREWTLVGSSYMYRAGVHPFDESWCVGTVNLNTYCPMYKIVGGTYDGNYLALVQGLNSSSEMHCGAVIFDEDFNVVRMPANPISIPGYAVDASDKYNIGSGIFSYQGKLCATVSYRHLTPDNIYKVLLITLSGVVDPTVDTVEEVLSGQIANSYCALSCPGGPAFEFNGKLYFFLMGENSSGVTTSLADTPLSNNFECGIVYKNDAGVWTMHKDSPLVMNPVSMDEIFEGTYWCSDAMGVMGYYYDPDNKVLYLFNAMKSGTDAYRVGRLVINLS
jgi:hypothetical protein